MSELEEDAAFLRDSNVPALINEMMLHLLMKRPTDPVGTLQEFLGTLDRSKFGPGKAAGASAPDATASAVASRAVPLAAAPDPGEDPGEDLHDLSGFSGDLDAELRSLLSKGVTRFDISKNTLTGLPAPLVGSSDVTSLSIEENQFDSMEPLLSLPNLRYLNISDNPKFKVLPSGLAERLPRLEKIDAYKCGFSGQLSEELVGLKHLTYLNFYNNSVLKAPEGLGTMTSLTELNLASNKIMAIQQGSFDQLSNLRRLALFWNRLLRLPSLTPLSALQTVQLNGNQLPEMPEFGMHPELEELNVSENKIEALNETLFNLSGLESFAAGKNLLTDAGLCAGPLWAQLSGLKKLQLPNNKLTTIPDCFLDLPSLVVLELNGNSIAVLPENMDRLENKATPLNHLFIAENKITALPPSMASMQSLKRLALRGCPLDMSNAATLSTYERLEAIIKSKGVDGKFIDTKRGVASPRMPPSPTSLTGLESPRDTDPEMLKRKKKSGAGGGGEVGGIDMVVPNVDGVSLRIG